MLRFRPLPLFLIALAFLALPCSRAVAVGEHGYQTGGAYDVMGSKHLGGDINLAWPTAEIAVMGAQGAVNILYRKDLAAAEDPEARRVDFTDDYTRTLCNPYQAAERGYIDRVILPNETRTQVIRALRTLRNKRKESLPKKHGNIPL